MIDIAISIENLGKMCRIGAAEKRPRNLREALGCLIASPFAYLQRMMRPPSREETLWALKDVSFEVQCSEAGQSRGRADVLMEIRRVSDRSRRSLRACTEPERSDGTNTMVTTSRGLATGLPG